MKVLDPGHMYSLDVLDGRPDEKHMLTFVKRNDPPEKYPGNKDAYSGVQIQEVCRALIDRLNYLQKQEGCDETLMSKEYLESVIFVLELRNARKKGRVLHAGRPGIADLPTCAKCGHIECPGDCHRASVSSAGKGVE